MLKLVKNIVIGSILIRISKANEKLAIVENKELLKVFIASIPDEYTPTSMTFDENLMKQLEQMWLVPKFQSHQTYGIHLGT